MKIRTLVAASVMFFQLIGVAAPAYAAKNERTHNYNVTKKVEEKKKSEKGINKVAKMLFILIVPGAGAAYLLDKALSKEPRHQEKTPKKQAKVTKTIDAKKVYKKKRLSKN